MNNYSLSGLNVPAEEFLRPFFALNEKICLRVFSDKPDTAFSGHKLECTLEGYSDIAENLRLHNEQNRGVYFVINYGGHEDADISRVNAHFMEMDDLPLDEQLTKIQAFPLEPSLVVKTRKSLHCYWLMTNADKEKFRYIQKRLIAHFGADPACINESRVFRLPGFLHCKEEPILVECIKFNPELRYTQEQLEAVLPEIPNEPAPATSQSPTANRGTQKGLVLAGKQCAFFQHCKKNAKTLSEPDWYAMITNLAVFEGGEDAVHKLSALYPKYNFEQTQAKIEHFYKSGTKPMTCQRIAEKGFKCPRQKYCKCKSPAGLAYFPLDIKDIRKLLAACRVTGNPVNDVFTVRQFLNDYMYNIDTGLAVTFINSEVKAKFNLKASDLKQLISYHAEVSRAFFSSQKSKRDTAGTELPSWYETTDRGSLRFMPGMLAKHLAEKFHAFYCTEQYYFYGNGVYSPQNDKDAKATVQKHLQPRHMLLAQINDAEGQWQLLIRKPVREINPNPFIINVQNGLYNVLDGSLKEHDVGYYSTVQMKAKYDPEAECPRFLEFLNSTMEEPEIHLLQEIYGYFFVPITKAQKSFLLCGEPNVGKSTILTVLQEHLLGADNVSNIPLQNLSDRFQPAELFGKMANIYADLPSKKIDDASMFKAVTGEDYITGERKHKDPFSFKPFARFMYSCNDIPRNYGDRSEAFYRRLIIIRFSKKVPADKRDFNLVDKLSLERDGILLWAIEGLKRLIANNYQFTETNRTKAEVQAYRIQNNNVLAFIDEMCAVQPGGVCYRQELYDEYKSYCSSMGTQAIGQPNFNTEVGKQQGVKLADESITRRAIFNGIKLR